MLSECSTFKTWLVLRSVRACKVGSQKAVVIRMCGQEISVTTMRPGLNDNFECECRISIVDNICANAFCPFNLWTCVLSFVDPSLCSRPQASQALLRFFKNLANLLEISCPPRGYIFYFKKFQEKRHLLPACLYGDRYRPACLLVYSKPFKYIYMKSTLN